MQNATLKVDGMSCDHCKGTVTKVLKAVAGVQYVEVDLGAGEAKVAFDPSKATVALLKESVEAAGYDVRP